MYLYIFNIYLTLTYRHLEFSVYLEIIIRPQIALFKLSLKFCRCIVIVPKKLVNKNDEL